MIQGIVYLVGGGPGDPELLTVKGLRCLKKCEVVIYDALINPMILEDCPPASEKIFVGKRRHRHTFEQNEINELMLKRAREGKSVCRLKGGDPFLFGRGGEEAEFLFKHGIPFEIIPGISSVIGISTAVGIPLTHRDYASHVTIVTGSGAQKEEDPDQWKPYHYLEKKTLVILMGFAHTEATIQRLLSLGWPEKTPLAMICSGTWPCQIVIDGTLNNFTHKAKKFEALLSAPAMLVVGEVVSLRNRISPQAVEFDFLPLSQLKIHEGTLPERVQRIKEELRSAEKVLTPLWIERNHSIVLNGHHRLAAFKELKLDLAPCLLLDYSSPYLEVQVCEEASIQWIDKKAVLKAALDCQPFPPRSSFHLLKFNPPQFETPLFLLK